VLQNVALLMMKQNQDRYFVKLTPDIQGQVSMMAIVGAMCGQMIFGVVGDQVRMRKGRGSEEEWVEEGMAQLCHVRYCKLMWCGLCVGCPQFGRRNTFITTAVLVIIGTVAQACIQVREEKTRNNDSPDISLTVIGQ
jgi:MFS family permease